MITDDEIGALYRSGDLDAWHAALAQQQREADPRARAASSSAADEFVTRGELVRVMKPTQAAIQKTLAVASNPNLENYLKTAVFLKVVSTIGKKVKEAIVKATAPIDPLTQRTSTLEARVGALSMLLKNPAQAAENTSDRAKALESLEHRLSRHAEHLARLQTKIQELERR